jgi:hypothetical protein
MKKLSSYDIALSALACALSVLFNVVGAYSEILLFTGYLLSAVALMLPLSRKSYGGYALAYVGASALSLMFASARFWDVVPFIVFFGLHPLVNELQLRTKINTWMACFIKAVWFDFTMYLVWSILFEATTVNPLLKQYLLPIILVVGTAFFVFYDYTMYRARILVNNLANRFLRK